MYVYYAAVKQGQQSITAKTTKANETTTTVTESGTEPTTHTTKVQLTDELDFSPCSEWTVDRVQQWLSDNNLKELQIAMKDYDGKCLVHMEKLCHRCPEFFHSALRAEFQLNLLSVIKLSAALEELSREL